MSTLETNMAVVKEFQQSFDGKNHNCCIHFKSLLFVDVREPRPNPAFAPGFFGDLFLTFATQDDLKTMIAKCANHRLNQ